MPLKEKLTSRLAIKFYIIISSLFILVFVLDSVVMPLLVHSRDDVKIPDVTGKKATAAMDILLEAGLEPQVHDTMPHPKIAPGNVVLQNPVAGAVVREGRNVYLTISGGEARITMPNLRGRSLRDARITLEQLDLRLGMVTYEASELPAETIVSQSVPPGKKVRKNQMIEIAVSGGSDIEIEIPYVVGFNLDEAQQRLLEGGLRLGTVTYKESSNLLPNTVMNQTPVAGDPAAPNTPVNLVVSH
ncbi:MAG: PASTA domain-containing protein [Bacteroidetes bacterium]|nr:PASTA domain-containing protein [Bacteroidota bacterium]